MCVRNKWHHMHPRQRVRTHNQQNPYNKLNKTSVDHIQSSYFQILTQTHNPRSLGLETWNTLRKRQNPYLFLKIGEEMMKRMEVLCVEMVILAEGGMNKTMNNHEMWGKNEKFLKTALKVTLHTFFATGMSCEQVAKSSHQKPVWQNLKNLSKCFSWLEGPLASKSRREPQKFLYNLTIGASTHEQVAKPSRENFENPKFWKFF